MPLDSNFSAITNGYNNLSSSVNSKNFMNDFKKKAV